MNQRGEFLDGGGVGGIVGEVEGFVGVGGVVVEFDALAAVAPFGVTPSFGAEAVAGEFPALHLGESGFFPWDVRVL